MHRQALEPGLQILTLDLVANRAARKYSRRQQVLRVVWSLGRWAIRLSPRPFFGWRRAILRLFGARIGHEVHVYPSTHIYMPWNLAVDEFAALGENVLIYNLGEVRIGRGVTVSYRAHICAGTHDFSKTTLPLLKPPVTIEENAWIGTEAFIGPGVTVGSGAIIGARAVVVKDVQPLHIVVGNPAKAVGVRRPSEVAAD
jgi:putative colanic acid biosynthesis acetyltransferase WcaF